MLIVPPKGDAITDFAVLVVETLRKAGHTALLAGGCVRDFVMGRHPKDYDVATDARPEQVRQLFGPRRTLAVGQAFGVIVVLAPRRIGQIEVATFRKDLGYSDGRHPDGVAYSTAEEDARRRDFTINGLFLDPTSGRITDYVGGLADIEHRIVRAIGDADARFGEDKLRMLRAVRFATTLGFAISPDTLAAIQTQAASITCVSHERIGWEMRRMWTHPTRSESLRLLHHSGLLYVLIPELEVLDGAKSPSLDLSSSMRQTSPGRRFLVDCFQRLDSLEFATALAVLICVVASATENKSMSQSALLAPLAERFRLTRREQSLCSWITQAGPIILAAKDQPWPRLQRILVHPEIHELLAATAALADNAQATANVEFCRKRTTLAPDELNPKPLLNGSDLQDLRIPEGPVYTKILEQVRDAQLLLQIRTPEEARIMAAIVAKKLAEPQ
jgi:tRNA nucleotidyltransferase/poly(A) polymerase